MISGNCNRSPQYNAMGPPGAAQRYNPQAFMQQQQQHPHLLFMAGGTVRTFPQMSRGFSMMPNRGGLGSNPTVVQCNMQTFGNNFGYHHASPAPLFHQQQHHHHHLLQPPQVMHNQQHQQPQYVPQPYIAPLPAASHNQPTSGFINGIKNMVKGIINPLNCDFYSDHHKNYNPKYRNNYMLDMKNEDMSYKPPHRPQPECHVKSGMVVLDMNKPTTKIEEKKLHIYPEYTRNTPNVEPIFNSEDFPELPVPRRSRSATLAKTEITPPKPPVVEKEKESPARKHPPPKGTFFEIMCTTTPSGRRPTFGGRLKVVPPPFSLNESPRSCSNRQQSTTSSSTNNNDCDIEEDSFVIFSNNDKPGDSVFTSFSRPPRQRQLSECSDDSFVVFFTEDADCIGGLQVVDDDDDDDDDDDEDDEFDDSDDETSSEEEETSDDDDDEEDDGIDVVDSSFLGRHNKTDRNKCNSGSKNSLLCSQQITCHGVVPKEHKQLDSGFDEKKVTFDPHPEVHVMHTWNFAYRAARKGHWEDFARDRTRFQKRIERTSVYLNPVLTPEHREKIYRSRFCDDAAENLPQQQCPNPKPHIGSLRRASVSLNDDDNQKLPKLTKLPDCARF